MNCLDWFNNLSGIKTSLGEKNMEKIIYRKELNKGYTLLVADANYGYNILEKNHHCPQWEHLKWFNDKNEAIEWAVKEAEKRS